MWDSLEASGTPVLPFKVWADIQFNGEVRDRFNLVITRTLLLNGSKHFIEKTAAMRWKDYAMTCTGEPRATTLQNQQQFFISVPKPLHFGFIHFCSWLYFGAALLPFILHFYDRWRPQQFLLCPLVLPTEIKGESQGTRLILCIIEEKK